MKSRTKVVLCVLGLLVSLAVVWSGWNYVAARLISATNSDTILYIPTNGSFQGVLDSLDKSEVLKNSSKFERIARREDLDKYFKSGRYKIKKGDTYTDIIRRISTGAQSPINVTFNNIRTIDRLAAVLARSLEADSLTFLETFINDSITAAYGFTPSDFIAMFIPNTYEFYWNTSPEKFVHRMNKEYEKFWTEERKSKLKRLGLSQKEAITLASIVYEETKMSDEMPRVAGVYINRLRMNMPLQADPTVKFAMGDFGLRRVLRKHLSYDSPYNTYVYAGLPPGAICMPSIKALDAVLNYEDHKFIYFCARPDFSGYHSFAVSLSEHNRNAQAYAQALNKRKIYK